MILQTLLSASLAANIGLGIFAYVVFRRKARYKEAFHSNVEKCRRILEYGRKNKELTQSLELVFVKLLANAREQNRLVEQANEIVSQEEHVADDMIEVSGNLKVGF